ncbi:MAG: molybdenum cofactor biosynthesis protein MoaE [Rhodospirillaceae bacterium]|nr:molybdenum cofactor biosynthesis protein MoaE [Rhodospirillaceae bacterium]
MMIRVQREPFDPGAELNAFMATVPKSGGIASFVGQVRDFKGDDTVHAMTLEHYPGMAEREFAALTEDARGRWALDGLLIIHRYGELRPPEPIVLVAAAAAHRADAFAACEFLMDWLKTKAPFWKKEALDSGEAWVAASADDDARADRWKK